MAQLVERSLPIPEVRGSNPVIGKIFYYYRTFVYCQLCIEKMKIKKKEAGNGPFLKKNNVKLFGLWSVLWLEEIIDSTRRYNLK